LDDIAANIQSEMLHCFLLACYKIYKSRLTYYSKTLFILLSSVSIFLDAAADIFFVIPVQFLLIHVQIARLGLQNLSVFLNFRPSYTQQQESFTSIGRFSNITVLGERHSSNSTDTVSLNSEKTTFINFYCLVVTGVMDKLEEAGFLRRERHE